MIYKLYNHLFFQLLDKRGSETLREKAEDLECLCKIMNTVGRRLDHDKAKVNTLFLLVPKMGVERGGGRLGMPL